MSSATSSPIQDVTTRGEQIVPAIVADPTHTLVAMDFDGTLSPIVDDPEQAVIHPRSAAALQRLGEGLGTLAIVTGRPVATVRRLASLQPGMNLVVLGQYGVERWDAVTDAWHLPPAPEQIGEANQQIRDLLAALAVAGHPVENVVVEDKGRALGVHTRGTCDPAGVFALLCGPVGDIARRLELHLEPGRFVLEVRASGTNKGDALESLAAELHARVVVMCGDDLGDLTAFDALELLADQGATVAAVVAGNAEQPLVAERADVLCDGPDGIADWLERVADALG